MPLVGRQQHSCHRDTDIITGRTASDKRESGKEGCSYSITLNNGM